MAVWKEAPQASPATTEEQIEAVVALMENPEIAVAAALATGFLLIAIVRLAMGSRKRRARLPELPGIPRSDGYY